MLGAAQGTSASVHGSFRFTRRCAPHTLVCVVTPIGREVARANSSAQTRVVTRPVVDCVCMLASAALNEGESLLRRKRALSSADAICQPAIQSRLARPGHGTRLSPSTEAAASAELKKNPGPRSGNDWAKALARSRLRADVDRSIFPAASRRPSFRLRSARSNGKQPVGPRETAEPHPFLPVRRLTRSQLSHDSIPEPLTVLQSPREVEHVARGAARRLRRGTPHTSRPKTLTPPLADRFKSGHNLASPH